MTEHKGRILSHRSSLGGACFVLEFPVTEPGAQTLPAEDSAFFSKPADPPKHSGNILVLDDEKALAEMLGEMLDILGHKALVCHSAERALELIETHSFDVIISDFRMPGLDGRQFYELAKQKHPELARRIIFLTGDVVNEETQGFIRSTGNPHLEKPFDLARIRQAVDEVLAKTASARMAGSS
jgi:CheY-like chemotaxis protein